MFFVVVFLVCGVCVCVCVCSSALPAELRGKFPLANASRNTLYQHCYINTSITFYYWQLWTYSLWILEVNGTSVMVWPECIAGKGFSAVLSCLYRS